MYICIIIVIIILLIFIIIFKSHFIFRENLTNNKVPTQLQPFIGIWHSKNDTLTINYAGQGMLLEISKKTVIPTILHNKNGPPILLHTKTFIENPPLFRAIYKNPGEITLISSSKTYNFPATDMIYFQTKNAKKNL